MSQGCAAPIKISWPIAAFGERDRLEGPCRLNTPIAYIVFNRPRHTRESFAVIRAQRPPQLFIIADGPRKNHPTDAERCQEVREIVAQVDWPCEVKHHYAEVNMGCKVRVSSGLDWVFSQVEQVIVLEDDCVPHPDFFNFCSTLLSKYAMDDRVWVITGNNFQDGQGRGDASYYFSKYNHCWGWASWRRAWQHYQVAMPSWPTYKNSPAWKRTAPDRIERKVWTDIFDRVARGEIDTWDYQWTFCAWEHGGLTATPNVNLVTNIGFGPDATHTVASVDQSGLAVASMGDVHHPRKVSQDIIADRYVFNRNFGGREHPDRFYNKLTRRYKQLLRLPAWLQKKYRSIVQ